MRVHCDQYLEAPMKKTLITILALMASSMLFSKTAVETESTITSVILYQNQAEITRTVTLTLPRGTSTVAVTGLPRGLMDWSARAGLPKGFQGKILSVEVEKKALVSKRRSKILAIEKKLETLREKDQVYIDRLEAIKKQRSFLDSIINFTNSAAKKEMVTRIPRVEVWQKTMSFTDRKLNALLAEKRQVEKKREDIGKQIQKLEFDLRQVAGSSYYSNYQVLNDNLITNRSKLSVQQYAQTDSNYQARKRFLVTPEGNVEYDKRFIVSINVKQAGTVPLSIRYLVRNTSWGMIYDLRADRKKGSMDVIIHGNIFQRTGEDWNNVTLALSTGSPVGSISDPSLSPWFLNIYSPPSGRLRRSNGYAYKSARPKKMKEEAVVQRADSEDQLVVAKSGSLVEITIPMKQTVASASKRQRKYISQYRLGTSKPITWYYECVPQTSSNAFMKALITNTTRLPWLRGRAQVFLDKQFTGNSTIPHMLPGSQHELVMNVETGITTTKKLVKKFEDSKGLFGNKRRILYTYQLNVKNRLDEPADIVLRDAFPVSQNKKIDVEIKSLSHKYIDSKKEQEKAEFQQGIRTWKFKLSPGKEKTITYELSITYEKDLYIRGLR